MRVGLIDAVRAAVLTDHCSEHTCPEHPRVEFPTALAERILEALLRPCSKTVKRDRKSCNAHFRHDEPFPSRSGLRIEAIWITTSPMTMGGDHGSASD